MFIDYLDTPLGNIEIMATDQGVSQVIFCGEQRKAAKPNEITEQSKQQLTEYFDKDRTHFTLPLSPQGTAFQKSVWQSLTKIPFGGVKSYGEIASTINNPKAAQAVGGANGRNPIAIIVPCHRVIGANGSLTGYAGGLERKSWLLQHEGIDVKESDEFASLNIENIKSKRQGKTQFLR